MPLRQPTILSGFGHPFSSPTTAASLLDRSPILDRLLKRLPAQETAFQASGGKGNAQELDHVGGGDLAHLLERRPFHAIGQDRCRGLADHAAVAFEPDLIDAAIGTQAHLEMDFVAAEGVVEVGDEVGRLEAPRCGEE